MDFKNKKILLTGSTSGIGRALAIHLANLGADIILLAKDEKKLIAVYDEITEKSPNCNLSICNFDLSTASQKDYEQLQNSIRNEYSKLDILFHNAAILDKLCPIDLYEPYLWLKVMQINVNASFLLTHYTLPLLKLSKKAQIWFMSSSVANHPRANWGAYSTSKAAQDCLMKTLACEQTNMIINSINPGATHTKMRSIAYPFENKDELPSAKNRAEKIVQLLKTTTTSGCVIKLEND